jgi:hypothetical protein
MVSINLAYTAPINPAGVSPSLTESQVWLGLERKGRKPQEFVPAITSCNVISEEGDTIIREIKFMTNVDGAKTGNTSTAVPVREVCVHHHPSRVDFQQQDGSNISNIISKDSEGNLLLTFSFEWRHPEVEDGSGKAAELKAKHEEVHFRRQDTVV